MIEFLKTLQESALLVPISTVSTGCLAFIAVFVNHYFVSKNLNKQLDIQVKQVQLQLSTELHKAAQKEKRDKLEQMHDLLHQYHSDLGEFSEEYRRITSKSLSSSDKFLEELDSLQRVLFTLRKSRSKAEVLASAYSDLIQDEFEQIRLLEVQILNHLSLLASLENLVLEAQCETEKKQTRELIMPRLSSGYKHYDETESSIFSSIQQIEGLIVKEIKESRKVENAILAL